MDNDDALIGRVLSRREAVRLLALSGAAALAGCSTGAGTTAESAAAPAAGTTAAANGAVAAVPSCVVRPELTVGPYFLDRQLDRSDIRTEPTTGRQSAGAPLALAFTVMQVADGGCRPLPGAVVDVWHCDAQGVYSGVTDQQEGFVTTGQTFLRGYQVTDANGVARFTTIFPGWYAGRAVHIHFKVRAGAATAGATGTASPGQAYEFTSQLFFDEATNDAVHARAPYASKGRRDTTNAQDGIYGSVGDQLLVKVAPAGDGYDAAFALGLDLSDAEVGKADSMGGPEGRGGRRPPPRPPAG